MCLDTGHKDQVQKTKKTKKVQIKNESLFYGRAFFETQSLSLSIRKVHTADSGIYWADFEGTAEAVTEPCFRVSVWEPLAPPDLETRILHWEQNRCNLSLLCTVPGATNVSYSWSCNRGHPGALGQEPQLDLQLLGDSAPMVCLCNATNSLSWSMATIDVTAVCLSTGSGASWSYCSVKGMLCLLVLGSLGTAVAITHLLLRQRGPPSHGAGTG
ncbi:PREDICTED: SLAM family member 5-like [Calidris pugnax]|uniref:SLAM family member 5-like n=1 Tax=Calidris pugnax TaxID=198806 RepID=UPI00071E4893|nr:PREDICTED: SLAM family member 5-like [Calidris pugnax]